MPPELSLTLIKGVPRTRPETRRIRTPEFKLGRGAPGEVEVDWVLPDASLTVSRLHCVLSRDQDAWCIVDVSRNGTWINREQERIAPRVPRPLQNGDRIKMGDYEFQVELAASRGLGDRPQSPPPLPPGSSHFPWDEDEDPSSGYPILEPLGDDWVSVPPGPPDLPGHQGDGQALLSRLAEGAGISPTLLSAGSMHGVGQALRGLVQGLRQVEMARQTIRAGFRISGAPGASPLSSAGSEQEALEALLVPGRSPVPPAAAVKAALGEISRHELATMAAMRSAILTLLRNLSPDVLQQAAGQGTGLSVLATQRKAKAWDEYEARYARIREALEDNFDRTFGGSFAEAYERALAAISDQDRQA